MSKLYNQNVTLITGLIFVVTIVQSERFMVPKCDIINVGGDRTAQCGKYINISMKDQNFYLGIPTSTPSLSYDLEAIEIIPEDTVPYVLFAFELDDFKLRPKLKRVKLERVLPSTITNYLTAHDAYKYCFEGISSILRLELINCGLNQHYKITWPKNLQTLVLDNNEFQSMDARECKNIQELSANGNHLVNIPAFHHPVPPLKALHVKGSSLENMTILDLAPLCELDLLEVEFPPGTHYVQKNNHESYCDCMMLKKWAKEVEISGPDTVACVEPENKDLSCPQWILEKARKLHSKCPFLKSAKSFPIFKILRIALFFILSLLLLAMLILYAIRHFHLKDKMNSYLGHSSEGDDETSTGSSSSEMDDEEE